MATFNLNGIPNVIWSSIAPGRYSGDETAPVYDLLIERLEDWLRNNLAILRRQDALLSTADNLAACLAPLQGSFSAGSFTEFANTGRTLTAPIAGARYLTEVAIAYADGGFPVSPKKLADLSIAATSIVLLSNLKSWRITGAQHVSLNVDRDKRITITTETAAFDLQAYEIAERQHASAIILNPDQELFFRWLGSGGESVAHLWAAADTAMMNEYGCSLRTFLRTMATFATHRVPQHRRISVATEEELASEVMEAFPVPDKAEVYQAIAALTTDRSDIRENLMAWQQRERGARLVTTPLLGAARPGTVIIVPALVLLAWQVHIQYLLVGRWPHPEGSREYMTPFRRSLKDIESHFNLQFEQEVAARFEQLGFAAITQIKHLRGIEIRGEIDVLAVSAKRGEIWIVEAKDPITPHSPMQFDSQVRNFKEWSLKHLARVNLIDSTAGRAAVSQRFRISDAEAFNVRSIIVTRNPSPASFSTDMPERVVWLNALPSALAE
jgi:hypothetical protein